MVRISDPCFLLRWNREKTSCYLCSKSKGPNFGPLLFTPLKLWKSVDPVISVQKARVRISDPCFLLRWNHKKNVLLSLFKKQGSEFRTLAFYSAEIVNNCLLSLFKKQGSEFRTLDFTPLKFVNNCLLSLFIKQGSEFRTLDFTPLKSWQNFLLSLFRKQRS